MDRVTLFSWNRLQNGDIIDVVAPSSATSLDRLGAASSFLKSMGFSPRIPKDIFGKELFCSNTDEMRGKHLIASFHDLKSKAIWCLHGGYGATRLLPFLQRIKKPMKAKIFIGSSDVTAIHMFLSQAWGWNTVFAPSLAQITQMDSNEISRTELLKFLFGKKKEIIFDRLKPINAFSQTPGVVEGPIVGGNLSTFCSLLGTVAHPDLSGKILFLEESGIRGYQADRLLEQIVQSGILAPCKAVVCGHFSACLEPDGSSLWQLFIERFASRTYCPVLVNVNAGLGMVQMPMPLGGPARLILGTKGILTCMSGDGEIMGMRGVS